MRFQSPLRFLVAVLLAGSLGAMLPELQAGDWITAPSYYSHDPQTGQRVEQYSPIGPFYTYARGDFKRSGYRQLRSSIQAGGSSDNMHIVEEWGNPVRPYGEWRFPYRPYSVPYDVWGPRRQFAGRGAFAAGQGFRGPGFGGRGGGLPPVPPAAPGAAPVPPFQAYPGYAPQPFDDGRYPPYDSNGPYGYPDLLQRPAPTPPAGT